MEFISDRKIYILTVRGTYDRYEIKVVAPEFNIVSIHKESYPGYWVVSSLHDMDWNTQDQIVQAIWKARRKYEETRKPK